MASPPNVLITGGSAGIGLELARCFAAEGARLVLVSENAPQLAAAQASLQAEFPGLVVDVFTQDLTAPAGPQQVWAYTQGQGIEVDVLVNNAGFGVFGYLTETDLARETAMLQLNILALHQLTLLYLPGLRARNRGGIINMASISAYQPVPLMATYAASKAFVLHFTRALRFELREQGSALRVLAVCPTGVRNTHFMHQAQMTGNPLFNNWMTVTPELVAKATYRAYGRHTDVLIPGPGFAWLNALVRRLPSRWVMWYARSVLGK